MKDLLKKRSENLAEWYTDVILKAELADYAPVKGCMVIRPYGYAIWEKIQEYMNVWIKKRGVRNAYFPLFIPGSYLEREKKHVEGFSPQVAEVTRAGGEDLDEPLIIRPTSETIMYEMYKKWTQSYRDLPILINQWCNIVRWEKRTYLFLRTSEFLWQEGHCAHATHEESEQTVLWALENYKKTYQELLAIYGVAGVKSESEKFAGGDKTYTYEILMPDGKALQGCTSHDLGQNFAKAFDWTVQDKKGGDLYPWQNSWGFSTRSIGGLILTHSDDDGLIMPPKVAPVQVIVIPVPGSEKALVYAKKIVESLSKDFRVEIDDKEEERIGFKFNKWEIKGVPVRIEIGDREVDSQNVTVVRRDNKEKVGVKLSDLSESLKKVFDEIQSGLLEKHKKFTEENTRKADSYDEFKNIMNTTRGFISSFWCGNAACEEKVKAETKATVRCLPASPADKPLDAKEESGKCVVCGADAKFRWLFGQSY